MKYTKADDGLIVRLFRGEKIFESLTKLIGDLNIPSATVTGLGAVMNTRLGFYHLHQKKYDEKIFEEEMELVSLIGNFAWFDNKPAIHLHVGIGAPDFKLYGGHLFEATSAVTVELGIQVKKNRIWREFDAEMGLNLLCLGT